MFCVSLNRGIGKLIAKSELLINVVSCHYCNCCLHMLRCCGPLLNQAELFN